MNTPNPIKRYARIANVMRDRLRALAREGRGEAAESLRTFLAGCQQLAGFSQLWARGTARDWTAASNRMESKISRALSDLGYQRDHVVNALQQIRPAIPSIRHIVEALQQIDDDFGPPQIDLANESIAVMTEPITLEGIPLGPFRIAVSIRDLRTDRPDLAIRAEALDPNPAAANDSYTHPHVCDERICLGDAILPLRNALADGRLADVFCIVRSVLQTYNPDSPYVSLDDWDGTACCDCGFVVHSDDHATCTSCEDSFCSDCIGICSGCDESTCLRCLEACGVCDEQLCPSCLMSCPVCGASVCADCLSVCADCEQPICETCLDDDQCPCQQERKDDPDEDQIEESQLHKEGMRRTA